MTTLSFTGLRSYSSAASTPARASSKRPTAGELPEALGVERVEADVHPIEALRPSSSAAKRGSSTPFVVREMSVISRIARNCADEPGQAPPHQRLAAGDAHLGDAELRGRPHEELHVLVGEDVLVGLEGHAFGRHAVDTAEVAPVGDRQAKIVDVLPSGRVHVRPLSQTARTPGVILSQVYALR